jgi:Mg2+-importing ATPase
LQFTPLPQRYWLILAATLAAYALLTQVTKSWFVRRYGV